MPATPSPPTDYQRACLTALGPLVGQRIRRLIRDVEGHFGFETDQGLAVWILCDPEGNGPGFAEVLQRRSPAGTAPADGRPACDAAVRPESATIRVLILLDGGLVQDVLADVPDIEAVVLDQDTEGMFDEDLVRIEADGRILHGTAQRHEATDAPELVEAVWQCV